MLAHDANFLMSPWLSVTMSDRSHRMIAPWQIAASDQGIVPIEFRYGDDFLPMAMIEFIGGLLQIFAAPEDEDAWLEHWHQPPDVESLRKVLEPFARHFSVYGETAAFQDRQANLGTPKPPSYLLCANGLLNAPISLQGAMAALVCLQAHCTDGGRGHRNSIRGAGALVTLPVVGSTLWHRVWSLVIPRGEFDRLGTGPVAYPWERATDAKAVVRPSTHPASSLFLSMPRRVRLGMVEESGYCPIIGVHAPLIHSVATEAGGESHPAENWTHPLTPYMLRRLDKTTAPMRGVHVGASQGWGSRVGLLNPATDNERIPSMIVRRWKDRIRDVRTPGEGPMVLKIHTFGMCYDHTAVLGMTSSLLSFRIAPQRWDVAVEGHLGRAVEAVAAVERLLALQISEAMCGRKPELGSQTDKAAKPRITEAATAAAGRIWTATEQAADAFQTRVEGAMGDAHCDVDAIIVASQDLLRAVRAAALVIYDDVTSQCFRESPQRVMAGRARVNAIHSAPSVRAPLGLSNVQSKKAA